MENLTIQRQLKIKSQTWLIITISLLFLLIVSLFSVMYLIIKRKRIAEHDRMELVINLLNDKINEIKSEKDLLIKEKTKARFAVIGSLFSQHI